MATSNLWVWPIAKDGAGRRLTGRAVHRIQHISRLDSGAIGGSVFEYIRKHPFVVGSSSILV